MARHFGAQHIRNGYAAMGASMLRPRYAGLASGKSIGEAIAAERARAARIAKASAGGKKK